MELDCRVEWRINNEKKRQCELSRTDYEVDGGDKAVSCQKVGWEHFDMGETHIYLIC